MLTHVARIFSVSPLTSIPAALHVPRLSLWILYLYLPSILQGSRLHSGSPAWPWRLLLQRHPFLPHKSHIRTNGYQAWGCGASEWIDMCWNDYPVIHPFYDRALRRFQECDSHWNILRDGWERSIHFVIFDTLKSINSATALKDSEEACLKLPVSVMMPDNRAKGCAPHYGCAHCLKTSRTISAVELLLRWRKKVHYRSGTRLHDGQWQHKTLREMRSADREWMYLQRPQGHNRLRAARHTLYSNWLAICDATLSHPSTTPIVPPIASFSANALPRASGSALRWHK